MYVASADFMTRNTERRVEVACPIYDTAAQAKIHHILDLCLNDNIRARQLQSDGTYCHKSGEGAPLDCQQQLMTDAIADSVPVTTKKSFWQKLKETLH